MSFPGKGGLGEGSSCLSAGSSRKKSQVWHSPTGGLGQGQGQGHALPQQSSTVRLQDSEKLLEALELWRIPLISGSCSPLLWVLAAQLPGRTISHALIGALGPTAGCLAAANRSGFLAGRAGQTRGWREKGKSLGGRRAGPAASGSRGRRAACSLPAPLGLRRAVRGPEAAGRRYSSASIPDLASPRLPGLPGPTGPLAVLPARGAAGRKGNAGTHTPAAARAHCTLAAARPRRRASEPSVVPRQGPAPARPCHPRRCPGSAPPAARRSHRRTRDIPTTCPRWRNWSRPPRLQHAGRRR